MPFTLVPPYPPSGDQPRAIQQLTTGVRSGAHDQVLLGVTGSGKTFTIANVIQSVQKPTLVIAHNKTLAAQLTQEFRTFFPNNAVEYFVSYYDYYQPEAYLPSTDTYIEKETQINEEIDRLRHAATTAIMTRTDVIVVATVSCIYSLGSPNEYKKMLIGLVVGQPTERQALLEQLITLHYTRNDILKRGCFRAKGELFELMLPDKEQIIRVDLSGGVVRSIEVFDAVSRAQRESVQQLLVFPAKHFVVAEGVKEAALQAIEQELNQRLATLDKEGKLLEAERLKRRTRYDLAMIREIGYCSGIENYSRYLSARPPGSPPYTLVDYFPKDFLMVIDESHVTVPQIGGMYAGDRSRKQTLVEHGFRLPSALDNRPLQFSEFEERMPQTIYTSATPGKYELGKTSPAAAGSRTLRDKSSSADSSSLHLFISSSPLIIEQIVRPTGLVDPEIVLKPADNQIPDLEKEIGKEIENKCRVLVTTLTKKMAEDLSEYLHDRGYKTKYLHSDVDTMDRIRVLEDLRRGTIDILIGVNLLREGLDLPEVSLVAILDADKEGFLRSDTSLIQTMGRAARNIRGRVILYANTVTGSMKRAITETSRRRKKQVEYNLEHGITPKSIEKAIQSIVDYELKPELPSEFVEIEKFEDVPGLIKIKMKEAAQRLEFERAALIRDEVVQLKKLISTR
ncbi:excinuclease ABC subunit UvrB [Candidatus Uhrbacteria bacterium]|nr:excinuclease ABC subunit UvrB [Candidatus Uhrbacteria bacterium]